VRRRFLRQAPRVSLTVARLFGLLVPWLLCLSTMAWAAPTERAAGHEIVQGGARPVVRFSRIEIVFSKVYTPPATGWQESKAEPVWRLRELPKTLDDNHAIWARMRIDRAALGPEPLAIYTQDNRSQIMVFLNGKELFRNFSRPDDQVQGWYRPYIVPVPLGALRPGPNEVLMRVDGNYDLSIGRVLIGDQPELQRLYQHQNLWRIEGVRAANYAMLALSITALLLWLGRRREFELLFLALSGVLWFLRDYHYFALQLGAIDRQLFSDVSLYALFFAASASNSFTALFVQLPLAKRVIALMFGVGLVLCGLHQAALIDVSVIFFATFLTSTVFSVYSLYVMRRSRFSEQWMLLLITVVLTATGIHDIGRFPRIELWEGLGFYIQPYIGFIFCIAFLLSFGKRALGAFTALEQVNQTLEQRIAEARSDLSQSEAKRRELEVTQAIDSERTRLMREMHDGIGSNLVTALAIAEQQKHPPTAIKTLKRAISDLKITVDSLEPVEGDLVALLANLRHRMARDLNEAGLVCKWKAEPCPPLPWLDATNALHVLRIFQEAIGNALAHSSASELEIGCHPATQDGQSGLCAYASDNGKGFANVETSGKGIANMRSRAESLHGKFTCDSAPGLGTRISVWLPCERG
jgi:signal transduction histidine kinase